MPNEETYGKKTLWQSIYQLEAIGKKLGGRRDIEESAAYIIKGRLYFWKTGKCQPSAFSARALQGNEFRLKPRQWRKG